MAFFRGDIRRSLSVIVFCFRIGMMLNQIPTGNATYLIRRNYIEITTFKQAKGRFIAPSLVD